MIAKPLKRKNPDFCSRLQIMLFLGLAGFLVLTPPFWADESASVGKKIYIQAAIQGTDGGMYPKGDCDESTDEEIWKAVEYMLSVVESR